MLVLARKPNQEIQIAEHIKVKVLSVKGQEVRLGIVAPTDIPIHRTEAKKKAA